MCRESFFVDSFIDTQICQHYFDNKDHYMQVESDLKGAHVEIGNLRSKLSTLEVQFEANGFFSTSDMMEVLALHLL